MILRKEENLLTNKLAAVFGLDAFHLNHTRLVKSDEIFEDVYSVKEDNKTKTQELSIKLYTSKLDSNDREIYHESSMDIIYNNNKITSIIDKRKNINNSCAYMMDRTGKHIQNQRITFIDRTEESIKVTREDIIIRNESNLISRYEIIYYYDDYKVDDFMYKFEYNESNQIKLIKEYKINDKNNDLAFTCTAEYEVVYDEQNKILYLRNTEDELKSEVFNYHKNSISVLRSSFNNDKVCVERTLCRFKTRK